KIARHDAAPGRLYMQNHGGWADGTGRAGRGRTLACYAVTTTATRGDRLQRDCHRISDFGFPIVVHPHDADTVYVMPLEPATRSCPGGAPAVWRSENAGES